MLGDPDSHYSWRAFAAIVSLPAFVCWFLTYRYVPESAQYFTRRRLFTEAENVVNHIRTTNQENTKWASETTGLLAPFDSDVLSPYNAGVTLAIERDHPLGGSVDSVHGADKSLPEAFRSLFDPILRVTTVSLLLSWFCLSFGSYGLATWITVLFKRIGLSDPFANAFIYAAANLPGNLLRCVRVRAALCMRRLSISIVCRCGTRPQPSCVSLDSPARS